LASKLYQLQNMHQQDMAQLQRHSIRKYFVTQDLQALKGILASIHSGFATPEQTIRFTARMKTGVAHNFWLTKLHMQHDSLIATYQAALYRDTRIQLVKPLAQAWQVRTDHYTYLLQREPQHTGNLHISHQEVRLLGGTCANCTLAMHTEHGWYKILREGWISCNYTGNITVIPGTLLHIDDTGSCSNDIMRISSALAQISTATLRINMSTDSTADEILLHKYISNGSKIGDTKTAQQRHQQSQKLLHKNILLAQQEMIDLTNWAESIDTRKVSQNWTVLIAIIVIALLGIMAGLGWVLYKKFGQLGCAFPWNQRAEEDDDGQYQET
jgi:hypothetical protein